MEVQPVDFNQITALPPPPNTQIPKSCLNTPIASRSVATVAGLIPSCHKWVHAGNESGVLELANSDAILPTEIVFCIKNALIVDHMQDINTDLVY